MTAGEFTADYVLTTTRAVRKRLDFDRPVEDATVRECAAVAMQSPSGSNDMTMAFVIVRDPAKRRAVGEIYQQCYAEYKKLDGVYIGSIQKDNPDDRQQQARSADSADYLAEHMGHAPALVLACNAGGRLSTKAPILAVSQLSNVLPAMWSFMLAARARGLGMSWTTVHLMREREVAEILDIPYDSVQQTCLSPLAYTVGLDFRPASRPPVDHILHWDTW